MSALYWVSGLRRTAGCEALIADIDKRRAIEICSQHPTGRWGTDRLHRDDV